MDGHAVDGLGLPDDTEDDVGEIGRWFEQEPALQDAGGDSNKEVVCAIDGWRVMGRIHRDIAKECRDGATLLN